MHKWLISLSLFLCYACNRMDDGRLLNQFHKTEIDSMQNRIERALVTNFKDSTESTVDSILALRGSISTLQLARAYSQKTYIEQLWKRNYAAALQYTDSMLQLTEPFKDVNDKFKNEYVLALFAKGDINYLLGKYRLAFYYFVQARRYGEHLVNSCVNADYDYRMAMILYGQERYEEAIRYFHSTLEQQHQCDRKMVYLFRQQEILSNIGLSYTKLKEYDSAMYYYDKALAYIETKTQEGTLSKRLHDIATGVILGNKAKIYQARGETGKAINALKYNIRVNDVQGGDIRDALSSFVTLGEVYEQEHNPQLLYACIQRAQRILDSIPEPGFQRRVYLLTWKYHEMEEKEAIAIEYAGKYIALNDSLNVVERRLQNLDAQLSMEELEKEFELNLLKKDNQLRKNLTILFVMLAVLSLGIVVIIFLSLRNARRKNKELEKVNQDKDRIMGIVAHDLRNPIAAVSSLTEMLMETTGKETEQYELLKMIKTACGSSLELINEILLMAEMSGNRSQITKEVVDVNEFLLTVVNLIRFRAEEKNQEIEPDLLIISTTMNVDPEKFRRVVSNLITNAIKFSPPGAKIKVSAEKQQHERLLISVTDHGIGIPDGMKDKIFEPFTVSKRLGTSGEKPFGLGLSIARQIVEAHNGRIWFESEEGKGTTFFVELPL